MSDMGFGYCLISDEAESNYFGELEEALIHGNPITSSHGTKKGMLYLSLSVFLFISFFLSGKVLSLSLTHTHTPLTNCYQKY
jgi:hypothetical protein